MIGNCTLVSELRTLNTECLGLGEDTLNSRALLVNLFEAVTMFHSCQSGNQAGHLRQWANRSPVVAGIKAGSVFCGYLNRKVGRCYNTR